VTCKSLTFRIGGPELVRISGTQGNPAEDERRVVVLPRQLRPLQPAQRPVRAKGQVIETDTRTDVETVVDRGGTTAIMEPLQISESSPHRAELTELAVDLAARSAGLRRSLPDGAVGALADLVRAMNCYYSNLIEGHNIHPIDIERAMRDDFSNEPRKRDVQLEARAHVTVQRWIDDGGLTGRAATLQGICEIHRRFGERCTTLRLEREADR
jgi:hypothetical protein